MFKTKEELKRHLSQGSPPEQVEIIEANAHNEAIDKAFKSFAERIEFYKKYKDNPYDFQDDFPELAKERSWLYNHHNYDSNADQWNEFNNWLFDYCFGDVIE